MGNPPTDERPKRMDFWLTARARDVLEIYDGNKADYVNRAIVAYSEMLGDEPRPQLIFDGVNDLTQIWVMPLNHPGDQRWIRPLKLAAQHNGFLKPYAFLYTSLVNAEQPILIPRAMQPQWKQFLAGQGCKIDSNVEVSLGTYIDIDDRLHCITELVNQRTPDFSRKSIVWTQQE